MSGSVIFNEPTILVGFLLALLLNCFGSMKKVRPVLKLCGTAAFAVTVFYAMLEGANFYELGCAAAIFFVADLIGLWLKGGK